MSDHVLPCLEASATQDMPIGVRPTAPPTAADSATADEHTAEKGEEIETETKRERERERKREKRNTVCGTVQRGKIHGERDREREKERERERERGGGMGEPVSKPWRSPRYRAGTLKAPFWTQHHRKYTNQREISSSVAHTTLYGTVIVALAEAGEEKRGKTMSKSSYRPGSRTWLPPASTPPAWRRRPRRQQPMAREAWGSNKVSDVRAARTQLWYSCTGDSYTV